jgi:hypothetical protein
MGNKNIWYGVLEAGEKTSPVVRDNSIEASQGKIYLYNHIRNQFIEYAQAIVEPKLRELVDSDISRDELNHAFKAAREIFSLTRNTQTWTDIKPTAPNAKQHVVDEIDIDIDDEAEDFIDDVE